MAKPTPEMVEFMKVAVKSAELSREVDRLQRDGDRARKPQAEANRKG